MTLPEELVEAATEARCPNEHTAHKNDGPLKRTWVTCGDEELASRIWDTSSGYDLSDEIRWFFKSTLDEHHRATWPRYAVAAVLRALPGCEALVEELADVEHERWAKWMRWVYQHGKRHIDGSFTLQPDRAKRWRFLSQVPYADLGSETQEHDRIEARTSLAAIAKLADDA